eukprot:TRINITY_DN3875_c0_g1_i2.p1 TRINITY_DN3875_c0_g1~~TRINITY_DN3875_c0_g1_i2.p1  ORF type:complete len:248 (-),score=56.93 TRINITY_DN3875_c0_g1_i2:216-959(-)
MEDLVKDPSLKIFLFTCKALAQSKLSFDAYAALSEKKDKKKTSPPFFAGYLGFFLMCFGGGIGGSLLCGNRLSVFSSGSTQFLFSEIEIKITIIAWLIMYFTPLLKFSYDTEYGYRFIGFFISLVMKARKGWTVTAGIVYAAKSYPNSLIANVFVAIVFCNGGGLFTDAITKFGGSTKTFGLWSPSLDMKISFWLIAMTNLLSLPYFLPHDKLVPIWCMTLLSGACFASVYAWQNRHIVLGIRKKAD